jgi:hypothetical protein
MKKGNRVTTGCRQALMRMDFQVNMYQ